MDKVIYQVVSAVDDGFSSHGFYFDLREAKSVRDDLLTSYFNCNLDDYFVDVLEIHY